uniref:translocation and assembly module lipoprotein TamL n=1 Tax=Pararhodonellum marinum TaxID=2755358 RepID=UPI00188E2731|nr:BamA/TamA family outer membrane protein [Pararhodonellum marinum]
MTGCSLTKGLNEDQYLVYDVNMEGVEKSNREGVRNLIIQKPNTRIPVINFSIGTFIYNIGESVYDSLKLAKRLEEYKSEKDGLGQSIDQSPNSKKLRRRITKVESKIEDLNKKLEYGNWAMRTGNPKVIYDSLKTIESENQIEFYLRNQGYFDAFVETEVERRNQKASITYVIKENEPYLIDSMYTRSENQEIYRILEAHNNNSLIKKGNRYIQAELTKERQRIEDLLKENGFYTFSKSYIEYNVYKDTVTRRLEIEQIINRPSQGDDHQTYRLDSIFFTINSPSSVIEDEEVGAYFDEKNFIFYRDVYSERIINSRIFLQPGDLYNKTNILETQRQLANLDLFRFVNITFDTLGNTIKTRIFTQPNQKYQITNLLGASITEQLPGPFFSHSLKNRNLFRGAEIFELNFRAGLEGVVSATSEGGVFRSRELSLSGSVIFPQFLIPFSSGSLKRFGRYNPRTRTLVGYNYINRPEYIRESVNSLISYNWNTRNLRQQYTFNLLDANFIRSNLDPAFEDLLTALQAQGNNLINSFLPSYVSSISGQVIINFNQYGMFQKNRASLLRLFLESGGTTLGLLSTEFIEQRSLAYFQFVKMQADYRRYIPLGKKNTFAHRLNFGVARPYGVSNGILPYEKYFFAGGSTSIRAWLPRRLGPGSFTPAVREDGTFDYRFEQPGDILLEAMFEYRQKLFGYFDGAVFVDAGNIWTFPGGTSREGGEFRVDRFYKEIAVGTGVGVRMDFEFLVIRLDMGIKAYDPARPEGERWILDNLSFNRPLGERGQTVFNVGIGYPF